MKIALILFCLVSASVWAESGADALLQSVKVRPGDKSETPREAGQPEAGNPSVMLLGDLKLSDPFLAQFFSQWQGEKALPYDVNGWAIKVLHQDFPGAAHMWGGIERQFPGSFEIAGQAAQLYCLWHLNVPQTFFDQWVERHSNPKFVESRIGIALDQTISTGIDHWLLQNAVAVTPEQAAILNQLDSGKSLLYTNLKAWVHLRKGRQALSILEKLPVQDALTIPLAKTVALSMARGGDLAGAAGVLKRHVEPAIKASNDPKLLLSHDLEIARLLYQAGSLDGAEKFYEKIPSGMPEFLQAREELSWVWLRKGDNQKLRGEMATLESGVFDDLFAPDIYVIRAVSNLKLCYYNQTAKSIDAFVKNNDKWAKEIQAALNTQDPPTPPEKDLYSQLAELAVKRRAQEVDRLQQLTEHSITAALPTVGLQNQWMRAHDHMLAALENAKKQRAEEYRRIWKNRKMVLAEAIRKMQFVKVELMSEMASHNLDAASGTSGTSQKKLDSDLKEQQAGILKEAHDSIAFPYDGVVWPDELFKLRSIAQAKCLAQSR